eukprot:6179015-Pleurochrysis_carterae.AAC.3
MAVVLPKGGVGMTEPAVIDEELCRQGRSAQYARSSHRSGVLDVHRKTGRSKSERSLCCKGGYGKTGDDGAFLSSVSDLFDGRMKTRHMLLVSLRECNARIHCLCDKQQCVTLQMHPLPTLVKPKLASESSHTFKAFTCMGVCACTIVCVYALAGTRKSVCK